MRGATRRLLLRGLRGPHHPAALAAAAGSAVCIWSQSAACCEPEPTFTAAEVAAHASMADGVWVTLGDGVYDVTEFVRHHPGGDHILAAGGGPLEPLWAQWQVHLTSRVMGHLQPLRIGRLAPADRLSGLYNIADPYDDEPERDGRLGVLGARPFDSETAREVLATAFWTPQHLFYVRNHLPAPRIDEDEHRLTLDWGGGRRRSFSVRELREELPQATLHATLQCTGNRCDEVEPSAAGGIGQIGNAWWEGVRVRDLLALRPPGEGGDGEARDGKPGGDAAGTLHLHATGCDGYEVSIPLEKVLDARGDVLLAHSMNGEPLSRDHGAPLRLLAPGFVGARSVKWLQHLAVRPEESGSVWQKRYYRMFPPWVRDLRDIDYDDGDVPPVYEFPVQSAIVSPAAGDVVTLGDDGALEARGYAVSGAGQRIVSVRLSTDGGESWRNATLLGVASAVAEAGGGEGARGKLPPPAPPEHGRNWSWVLWRARVPVPPGAREVTLCCKAIDSAYNTQPERADYNLRGYLSNASPKVAVSVERAVPRCGGG